MNMLYKYNARLYINLQKFQICSCLKKLYKNLLFFLDRVRGYNRNVDRSGLGLEEAIAKSHLEALHGSRQPEHNPGLNPDYTRDLDLN